MTSLCYLKILDGSYCPVLSLTGLYGLTTSQTFSVLSDGTDRELTRKLNFKQASQFLGNIEEEKIIQVEEPLEPFKQEFEVIQSFAHLKSLTGQPAPSSQ
jgi:hypothetical protein